MLITSVTVTYGNRVKYLKNVVNSLFMQGVSKIIIVSNGSEKESLNSLRELKKEIDIIDLIELEENTGSANGFYVGIKHACEKEAEFIWLLDDDNKPQKDALKALNEAWENLCDKHNNQDLALLSYRSDRVLYSDAVNFGKPSLMLGEKNSFLGFHVLYKIKSLWFKNSDINFKEKDIGVVSVAPYGGLFFHSELISKIGLPNRSYYLYGDDYDFSYRITQNKGKIFLVKKSKIIDLEKSFHLIKNKKSRTKFFNTNSKTRIFYSVKNGISFEQNFVTNKLLYLTNAFIYILLVLTLLLFSPKHLWKTKYILKGIFLALKKEK